ncbi:MAG: tRNA (adenosine(37)-N6)-threonylcarbamoyltransferase complex ATPase subunit type 1 TsaE [Proteobacteria bacterium]|nr:tRNA (adenosine(37)-N6)-threonylcarbamoyltransferase complex ATPase subunit type 1 TsaE [Pseudomonadota bacterium]
MQVRLADLVATDAFAARLSRSLRKGDFVALRGELGVGKTVVARQIIRTIGGVPAEEVASPTFNLVLIYGYPHMIIWHFDLYRINAPEETWELGLEDALAEGIALVEWPERLGQYLPEDRIDVVLSYEGSGRVAKITGRGAHKDRIEAEDWSA